MKISMAIDVLETKGIEIFKVQKMKRQDCSVEVYTIEGKTTNGVEQFQIRGSRLFYCPAFGKKEMLIASFNAYKQKNYKEQMKEAIQNEQ